MLSDELYDQLLELWKKYDQYKFDEEAIKIASLSEIDEFLNEI